MNAAVTIHVITVTISESHRSVIFCTVDFCACLPPEKTMECTNDEVEDHQCASFQRFKYALYKLGNIRAARYYLGAAEVYSEFNVVVDIPRVVSGLHLNTAKELNSHWIRR